MTDTVLARLAEIKTMATPDLKAQWRELFDTEPPPYNRTIPREPAGLPDPGTGLWRAEAGDRSQRLEALGEQLDGGNIAVRRIRGDDRPIAGTRLIREWQGVEHRVTVLQDGYE